MSQPLIGGISYPTGAHHSPVKKVRRAAVKPSDDDSSAAKSGAAPYSDSVHISAAPMPQLSEAERTMLGKKSNTRQYPSPKEWIKVREFLLEKSLKRNPHLSPEMTAYTPGETCELMKNPVIQDWHKQMMNFHIPKDADLVVFVPCAATKPWNDATKGIYKSYNMLRQDVKDGKLPKTCFVTISEPLGIVPEQMWDSFPEYDNPGLFRNDSARAGRTMTREWLEHFGKNFITPFDEASYQKAIDTLGGVIAAFAENNSRKGRMFVSFVDDFDGVSTHTDMLRSASKRVQFISPDHMFTKRAKPREEPYPFLKKKIQEVTAHGEAGKAAKAVREENADLGWLIAK